MTEIDVVIPVYDGFDETVRCIESVLSSNCGDNGIHIQVINDCSPNEDLTRWLRRGASLGRFNLLENSRNLGFVATVNRGMSLNPDRDVILLNSDTIVANDWVARLRQHAESSRNIGTVTPFSNNATICSFPNFCKENPLLVSTAEMDAAFSAANSGEHEEIPTAVGFCMYITRRCLDDVGPFDEETFGKGYGEENDFCMRASRNGWRHLIAGDVFVAHVGGVSFSDEKARRVEEAQEILSRLYPEYHGKVHDFISRDPLRPYRIRAHCELLRSSSRPVMMLISHNLGGGVEKYARELETRLGEGGFFPVLRPAEVEGVVTVGLSPTASDRIAFRLPEEYDRLLDFCRAIRVGRVFFQHTMGIHPVLFRLAEDLGCAMDFMLHDYYLVNANPTLTDESGRFCSDPSTRDARCAERYPLPFGISAEAWRSAQEDFLARCERLLAPSRSAAWLAEQYFSDFPFRTIYHPDGLGARYPEPVVAQYGRNGAIKVLVIGAISLEKGADVVEQVALLARRRGRPVEVHLLGYACRQLKEVQVHGAYSDEEVDKRIEEIDPDLIWFPALWPETYSFTLSEALRSGRPILASSLGAFPERLEGRPWSLVMEWDVDAGQWLDVIERFPQLAGNASSASDTGWLDRHEESVRFYDTFWNEVPLPPADVSYDFSSVLGELEGAQPSTGERWLIRLDSLRRIPGLGRVFRLIPVSAKRLIVRLLSRRSPNDLIH